MGYGAAAQHADFDGVVEQHEIDCRLQRRRGAIVFGIEEFGIEQGDLADLALALDFGFTEVGETGLAEFGDPIERLALGLEHRVDQMQAAALVGENLPDEQALLELAALLGALLHQRPLGIDLLAGRQQCRITARHRHQELTNAQKARALAGHLVVEGDGVPPEEFFLHVQRLRPEGRRVGALAGLHKSVDLGKIFAGGLGIARQ